MSSIKPDGSGVAASGEAAAAPLPCQDSDNREIAGLSPSQAKVAFALKENIRLLAEIYGVERLGFLTLSFPQKVYCIKQAGKVYEAFRHEVISKRYVEYVAVPERHKDGGIHFHVIVVAKFNLREPAPGFRELDYAAIKLRDYSSVGPRLKREWAYLRRKCQAYGFGRHELMPVRTTAGAVAAYVGKYIAKNIGARKQEDRGARLVRYSRGTARYSCRFAWNSIGAFLWRKKIELLVRVTRARTGEGEHCFAKWFGVRWAYKILPVVNMLKLDVYPTGAHYNRDHPWEYPVPHEVTDVQDNSDQWSLWAAIAQRFCILGLQTR